MEWTCTNFWKKRQKILRGILVMQTLFLLMAVPVISVQANSLLQDEKVSLNLTKVSIKSVLEEIQRQTNLSFVYNEKDLQGVSSVNLNFKNKSVEEILNYIFKNTRLGYDIVEGVIIIKRAEEVAAVREQPQKKRTIRGTVVDDTKSPLPGVSIRVKGTTVGVATDIDGKYELSVEDNPDLILHFTYLGMKAQEIKIGTHTEINVEMQTDATDLGEVMVVAYGTTKKESFTGSAVSVKGDDVIKAAASQVSPERALQGVVAGVRFSGGGGQPGDVASIQIRGIGSINESTDPLYIIDGVPIESRLSMLNPNDIESMTVLKDAAATSLYGSRASNGVVIITTKKGQEGKTKFEVTYERGWSMPVMKNILKDAWMNGRELTEYSVEALKNSYLYGRKALPGQTNYDANNSAIQEEAFSYALQNLYSRAGLLHPDDPLDGSVFDPVKRGADLNKYLTNPLSFNWYDAIFRTGSEDKVNFSARGGGKDLNYFASLGYVNQRGIVRGSSYERYSGRIAINNKVNKFFNFSLSEGVSFATRDQNTDSGDYYNNPVYGLTMINPTQPIRYSNGELNPNPGWNHNIPNYVKNVDEILMGYTYLSSISNLTVQVNFTDWFNFRTVNGVDINYRSEKQVWTPESNDGKSTNGYEYKFSRLSTNIVTSNTLNFNKGFGDHNVSAVLGYEAKKYHYSSLSAEGQNFPVGKLMYLSNASVPVAVGEGEGDDRLVSWISKVDYNYKNKYFLSGSYRRDGTSRFLKDNRWGNFWSVSGAWTVSRENFLESTRHWLDNLRLKLSYGTNGNQPSDYFNSQTLYSITGTYMDKPAVVINSYGNPDLKWESSYTWNAGVDFSLWNGRLRGTVEYYNRLTKDLIDWAVVSRMSGWGNLIVNEGELRNTGLEITLDSRNIISGDFEWSTNFNISYMRAMVEKLADEKISHPYITKQGEKLNSFYTREWVGVDPATGRGTWKKNTKDVNGKVIDKTGVTHDNNEADRVIVGKGYPDWFGGLTNRFSYKGIELSFLLTFTLGGDLYDGNHYQAVTDGDYVGEKNIRRDALNYWKKPGDHAKNPIVIFNNPYNSSQNTSSRRVMPSDHLRIKNITLGYNLPKQWIQKVGLSNAKIYVNGNDVYTFYRTQYVNPEVNMSGTSRFNAFPNLKSWRVGINLQF